MKEQEMEIQTLTLIAPYKCISLTVFFYDLETEDCALLPFLSIYEGKSSWHLNYDVMSCDTDLLTASFN